MKNVIEYEKAYSEHANDIIKILKIINGDSANFNIKNFIIAKDGEKIIGCIRTKEISKNCLELSSLGVLPEHQNKGVGSNLISKLLKTEPKRPLFLLTSSNHEQYYNRFGANNISPDLLPNEFKTEYKRILSLPFTKNIVIISMIIE